MILKKNNNNLGLLAQKRTKMLITKKLQVAKTEGSR